MSRAHGVVTLVLAGCAAAALAVLAASTGPAGAAPAPPETGASAVVVRVTLPGEPPLVAAEVSSPPVASEQLTGWSYPVDGSVVRIGSGAARSAGQPGVSAGAQAVAGALAVSLFGGEVVAERVDVRATAAAGSASARAGTASSTVTGLTVLGQPVVAAPNQVLPLADWGTLQVLTAASRTTRDAGGNAGTAAVVGLRVELELEHAGLAAGAVVEVGVVEARAGAARAEAAARPSPPKPAQTARPRGDGRPDTVRPPDEPGASVSGRPDELVRPVPEGVRARLSRGGYVFPVFGPASFGDSFGAFRADVVGKWHRGEDIVATYGAPVLATAAGTVFSVGWNDIGGWRLWLRDTGGNLFYYAHLSAYSPLAVEGGRVRAGDVLGFVGDSGDAEGGTPHLHFEIHPAALLDRGYDGVVAPYPFLLAWRRAEDVSFDRGRAYLPGSVRTPTPPAGAVLLEATDISRTSGLVPGALERALAEPAGAPAPPAPGG